jgi:hypothetical protein
VGLTLAGRQRSNSSSSKCSMAVVQFRVSGPAADQSLEHRLFQIGGHTLSIRQDPKVRLQWGACIHAGGLHIRRHGATCRAAARIGTWGRRSGVMGARRAVPRRRIWAVWAWWSGRALLCWRSCCCSTLPWDPGHTCAQSTWAAAQVQPLRSCCPRHASTAADACGAAQAWWALPWRWRALMRCWWTYRTSRR